MKTHHLQKISPRFEYPVVFARGLFSPDDDTLRAVLEPRVEPRPAPALVFVDAGLLPHYPSLTEDIARKFRAESRWLHLVCDPIPVPGGERIKNDYRLIMSVVDACLEYRLCRRSLVFVVGGGAVLDAVGFAASIVHRGLRIVRLPTTTVSQGDSGVGVKTGMNLHGSKNTIGTFWPPFAVISDLEFLATLRAEHWISGAAEAFKVAVVRDSAFLDFLCERAGDLRQRNEAVMEQVVMWSARLHLEHIRSSRDPFEMGEGRPLDFGHWLAHKLESMSGFGMTHGHAVSVGLVVDLTYAALRGWITVTDRNRVVRALSRCGLPVSSPLLLERQGDGRLRILDGLTEFREHAGGRLVLIYPDGMGRLQLVYEVDHVLLEQAVLGVVRGGALIRE